jgi:Eukaryotic cytochrome b561
MEFKAKTLLDKIDITLNTINHALIGIATFYSTWYCINYGFDKNHTFHVLLASLGYQLLMAEGILSMYKGNTFTLFSSRTEKTNIHWMLQATGGILGLSAFFLEVVQRLQAGKRIFHIWHAKMGKYFMLYCTFII